MQVVLLERVEKLGDMGSVVTVKPGFARNFLLPTGAALRATKENIQYFEERREHYEAENLKKKGDAEEKAKILDKARLHIIRQAADSGHLYGSVSARDIADILTEKYCPIERQQVILDRPVKEIGVHTAKLRIHPEISTEILLSVAPTDEEAAKFFYELDNPKKAQEEKDRKAQRSMADEVEAEESVEAALETEASGDEETGAADRA